MSRINTTLMAAMTGMQRTKACRDLSYKESIGESMGLFYFAIISESSIFVCGTRPHPWPTPMLILWTNELAEPFLNRLLHYMPKSDNVLTSPLSLKPNESVAHRLQWAVHHRRCSLLKISQGALTLVVFCGIGVT